MLSKKQYFISLIFHINLALCFYLIFYVSHLKGGIDSINRAEEDFIYYLQIAQKSRSQGNYEEAIINFEKAIDLSKKIKLKEEVLQAIEGKAIVLWNLGRMKEATECFKQGLGLAREWQLPLQKSFFETCLEVHNLYQDGKIKREKMDYKGAITSFERALYLGRKIRCPELELKCLRQASLVYFDQNEIESFRLLNEKGLRMARLLSHTLEEGRFMNNIALYYLKKGDVIASFALLNKASILIEARGTKQDIADCLYNLGATISEMGFYDRAIKYFKKAMEIDKDLAEKKDPYILDLNNIGLCLLKKGKVYNDLSIVKESLFYFKEALRLAEENNAIKRKIMVLNNLSNALYLLGDKDLAYSLINEALAYSKKMQDKYHIIVVNDTLGNFYIESQPNLALKYLFEGLKCELNSNCYPDNWTLYYNIGRCYEKLNQLELAEEYYIKSIRLIDELRKQINYDFYQVGFLRNKQEVFDAIIRLKKKKYDQNRNLSHKQELFESVERTKAKSFLHIINNPELNEKSTLENNEIDKNYRKEIEKELSKVWSKMNNEEMKDKSQFDNIRKEDLYLTLLAERKNKQMNTKMKEENLPALKEIQENILDERTAILEYYLSDWGSLGIVIMKANFEIVDLPARKQIEDSIIGYTKLISNPPIKNITGELAAKRIYKEIFEPLEKWFTPEIENIIIIPDGFLYYLPFESLIKENGNKSDYLVKKFNIVYAPSVSSIAVLRKKDEESEVETKDMLAIGYPQYEVFFKEKKKLKGTDIEEVSGNFISPNGLQLTTLPYTKKEIKAIRSMFPPDERAIYMGKMASEEVIKSLPLDTFKIIHFACHGYIDESFPFRSALILTPSPEKGHDGFLQAHEISDLKLKAKLVVLSACQSARGPLEKAEGVLSLNRVFFTCGAKAVISSLWQVNDHSSAVLMNYFYRYLRKGVSIAQALRAAKIEMLTSRFEHPFYWASFVLNGEGFSVIFDQK